MRASVYYANGIPYSSLSIKYGTTFVLPGVIYILDQHFLEDYFGYNKQLKKTVTWDGFFVAIFKLVRSLIAINSIGWWRRMRWTVNIATISVLSHQMMFIKVDPLEFLLHDQHFAECVEMFLMWFIKFEKLLFPFASLWWFWNQFTNTR